MGLGVAVLLMLVMIGLLLSVVILISRCLLGRRVRWPWIIIRAVEILGRVDGYTVLRLLYCC